jgi:hypothetical protein
MVRRVKLFEKMISERKLIIVSFLSLIIHKERIMAWYYDQEVRVCGRVVSVSFRYGSFNGARVVSGKPLAFTRRVKKAIKHALNRPHKVREREAIEEAITTSMP